MQRKKTNYIEWKIYKSPAMAIYWLFYVCIVWDLEYIHVVYVYLEIGYLEIVTSYNKMLMMWGYLVFYSLKITSRIRMTYNGTVEIKRSLYLLQSGAGFYNNYATNGGS